jgi:hypothetical protein
VFRQVVHDIELVAWATVRCIGFFPSTPGACFRLNRGSRETIRLQLSNLMHAVPAFDDHTADDELSVHSLPARIAEVLRNNEYRLNGRGSVEDGNAVSLHKGREEIFHNTCLHLCKASNLENYSASIQRNRAAILST